MELDQYFSEIEKFELDGKDGSKKRKEASRFLTISDFGFG